MYEKKQGTLKEQLPKEKSGDKAHGAQNSENDELKKIVARYVEEAADKLKSEWSKEMAGRIASEREDAARLATMSSEERAKAEMDKRQKDFETERQQYISEKAEFDAAKELAAQNLPVTFARMVADSDKDVMLENISAFKSEYMKAIEAGLSSRLKGSTPKVSTEKEQAGDAFLSGLGM